MLGDVVVVVALKSFDGFVKGAKYALILDERVAHLLASDYLRLV